MLPELTKPIVELTLPSGSSAINSSFDPAANTLIIQYYAPTTTLNGWLRIHAPDVGGSAALLFALLIFFSLRHILRRPQSHGHLYCRVCNYDLTPWKPRQFPDSSLSIGPPTPAPPLATCPECGVSTQAKPPLRGRFMLRRILPILGVFLPIFLLSSILWYATIEQIGSGRTAWPFEALSQIRWWTLARPIIPLNYSSIFETYSLPTGQKVSTSVLDSLQGGGRPTSDLRYYAFAECSEESHWVNLAVVFDPATGHTRSYNMGDISTGNAYFHGYTPDEKEAVYTLTSSSPNHDGKGAARIFCVSLDTLAVREIVTVNFTFNLVASSNWEFPNIAVAVNNEPRQWAILITDGIDAGLLQYSPAPSGELGESKIATTLAISGYSSNKLSYSADDKLLLNGGTLEIIPETGAVRPLAVVTPATHSVKYAAVGALEIYSGPNLLQTIQIQIDPNISFLAAKPVCSSDGRWVLFQGHLNNNPARSLPPRVKWLLFDLSKVQPVDPGSPR